MSCPKCGSGAVFQGKCRECGAVVDPRRASSIAVARPAAALGDGEDETVLAKRKRAAASGAPTQPPPRRPEPDTDPRIVDPQITPRSNEQAEEARRDPLASDKPYANPERSNWYAAAGMRAPSERYQLGEDGEQTTRPHELPSFGAAVLLLVFAAAAHAGAVALGQSPFALIGTGVAGLAAFLLWRNAGFGRAMGWLYLLWCLASAALLATLLKAPLSGILQVLPAICLLAALHAGQLPVRRIAGGLGVLLALLGLAPLIAAGQRPAPAVEENAVEGSSYSDARLGFNLKVPDGVALRGARAAKDLLPAGLLAAAPRLVFATDDRSLSGGLVVVQQAPGAELANVLTSLNAGNEATTRNDQLAPDSLHDLEAEGWEFTTPDGQAMVVLCRTADGRAFGLFGLTPPAARVRGQKLFNTIAWSLQIKRSLADEP